MIKEVETYIKRRKIVVNVSKYYLDSIIESNNIYFYLVIFLAIK